MQETHTDRMHVSVSNLAAPIPSDPPGLETRLLFTTDKPLSPLAVYVNAIYLMYELSKHRWDDVLQRGWVTCELGYGFVIFLGTGPFLQTKNMVLSLYRSVLAMAYRLNTGIKVFDREDRIQEGGRTSP